MAGVKDQVAMMFGEHVAETLADHGLLRENHGPDDDEGACPPEFWRIYYRLDETKCVPIAGSNSPALTFRGGYIPAKIIGGLNDAFRALSARTFPGQVAKPSRYYWYSANQSKTDTLANLKYWTDERIAKFLDWRYAEFNSLSTARAYYTKLRQAPEVRCRLVGMVATEVETY